MDTDTPCMDRYGDREKYVDERHRHTSGGIAVGCDDACSDVPGTTLVCT